MSWVIISAIHGEPRYETKEPKYSNLFNTKAGNRQEWILVTD